MLGMLLRSLDVYHHGEVNRFNVYTSRFRVGLKYKMQDSKTACILYYSQK